MSERLKTKAYVLKDCNGVIQRAWLLKFGAHRLSAYERYLVDQKKCTVEEISVREFFNGNQRDPGSTPLTVNGKVTSSGSIQ